MEWKVYSSGAHPSKGKDPGGQYLGILKSVMLFDVELEHTSL